MQTTLPRRSAKQRPLNGVLVRDGKREAVVVTAHERRLVINVEADISAIPLARVRRDDDLRLRRTDRWDWRIELDDLPAAESWVFDLPMLARPNPWRRAVLALLTMLALIAGLFALRRAEADQPSPAMLPALVSTGVGRIQLAHWQPPALGGAGHRG